ncbi:MAG: amidase [Pseudomonadales bacterium]|jgi:amidase|nr:amidase [Pseudomonadales bacterium]
MNDPQGLDGRQLHRLDLVTTVETLASGAVSAEALTAHMLARIDATADRYRAYRCVLPEQALAAARACDVARAAGAPLGPLHGVPVAIKDLLELEGTSNCVGSPVYADRVSSEDAEVVRRLKAAGAVILGKLELTEGAFSQHHPAVSPPLNPWRADRWTGVSSSGSGVAVAARLCQGALGTDTGGSIRFPCAANGLVGLKATYGRISRRGAFPLAESLDHIGPMTRTVADAARLFRVLAGHDPRDANSVDRPVPDCEAGLEAGVAGLCLGIDREWLSAGVDARVVDAVETAAAAFGDAGARIVECRTPDASALVDGWAITAAVEAALAHGERFPALRRRFGPVFAALLDLGHRSTALDYAALERAREHYRRALDLLLADIDALLLPAMPFRVPEAELMQSGGRPAAEAEPITFTAPFDYSGHPALTLPAGLDEDGLPLAFQLVGRPFEEPLLLRLGAAWERARGPMAPPPGL